jgi:hypothetical protein
MVGDGLDPYAHMHGIREGRNHPFRQRPTTGIAECGAIGLWYGSALHKGYGCLGDMDTGMFPRQRRNPRHDVIMTASIVDISTGCDPHPEASIIFCQ